MTKFYAQCISDACSAITQHPGRHYTAQELATEMGVGASQFKIAFKQQTGSSLYAYQLKHKLEHACLLIDEGNFTLKSIAHKTGFRQLSNFNTAFKKHIGLTPGQYRDK